MSKLKDIMKAYKSKDDHPDFLTDRLVLPGDTTREKLERLFLLRSSSSKYPKPINSGKNERTVAICLVIVDTLFHEAIWKNWLQQEGTYGGRVLIHAKHPERIESSWVRDRLIPENYFPEWNSPEVVRAMLALIGHALKDEDCGRIVFGTETCIPLYPLQTAAELLFTVDCSWANARHHPESQWEEAACFRGINSGIIPTKAIWKALPGWIMLTRRHAQEIVALPKCCGDDLVRAWGPGGEWTEEKGGAFAPEETYFSTMLAILGYLRETDRVAGNPTSSLEVRRSAVTFASWRRRSDANPITYSHLSASLLRTMRLSGAVFGRKFDRSSVTLEQWKSVVLCENENENSTTPIPDGENEPTQEIKRQKIGND